MENQFSYLEHLPNEILLNIFSELIPQDFLSLTSSSKKFSSLTSTNSFWKEKCQSHFPHRFKSFQTNSESSWYAQFTEIYKDEYRKLSKDIQKIFSFVKEGDIEGLRIYKEKYTELYKNTKNDHADKIKQQRLNVGNRPFLTYFNKSDWNHVSILGESDEDQLYILERSDWNYVSTFDKADSRRRSILSWATIVKKQPLLDFIYQLAIKEYSNNGVVNKEKRDYKKRTLLDWAILCLQSRTVLEELLQGCQNIDARGYGGSTLLSLAVQYNHIEAIKLLIEYKASFNPDTDYVYTPLHIAVTQENLEAAKILLEYLTYDDILNMRENFPLYLAVRKGQLKMVELFLKYSFNFNLGDTYNHTLLHHAANRGHSEVVKLLLDNGAIVNFADSSSKTPLHHAVENNHIKVVKLLLDNGATVNVAELNGRTPLHIAVESNNIKVVKILLENKANIDTTDLNDETPIQIATNNDFFDVLELLERNASINAAHNSESQMSHLYKPSP